MSKTFYKITGFFFVALAALGVILPILPTTPLLLVAAACFARSSEKWHQRLLNHRVFGPMVRDWDEKKCIARKTKIVAISSVVFFGGMSMAFFVDDNTVRIAGSLLIMIGIIFILRVRECGRTSNGT